MKNLSYLKSKEWEAKFSNPVRDKYDLIARLMEISKYVISREPVESDGKVEILVAKNSRVYVFDNDGYFYSFCFPFSIHLKDGPQGENRLFYYGGEVTSLLVHCVTLILKLRDEQKFFHLADTADEIAQLGVSVDDIEPLWVYLLTFDSGYVRYEKDSEHEGPNHPLYHLDWYYDGACEVKTGLKTPLTKKGFAEILSVDSPCWFLHKPNKKR